LNQSKKPRGQHVRASVSKGNFDFSAIGYGY